MPHAVKLLTYGPCGSGRRHGCAWRAACDQ